MSIQKKIILIILMVSCIPLLLLSVISINYVTRSVEEETINQNKLLVSNVKLEINNYIDQPLVALKAIASSPSVQTFDLPQTKNMLVQVQKKYPDISLILVDNKGNQVVRGDNASLSNIADRAYFQAAFNGGEENISEVVYAKNTNRFIISLATPVRNINTGSIVGVMQGSIALSHISNFVTELSKDGKIAYVVDGGGRILAHPDAQVVKERTDLSNYDFIKTALAEKKNGFAIIDTKESGKKLVAYEYDSRTGWLICLEVPYGLITAKTHSLSVVLVLVTLVALVIIGVFVTVIAKRIVRPIVSMQKTAIQISQGDLTRRVDITSRDEIGLLAEAFNTMVMQLKNLILQISSYAEQVAASSEELTAGSEQSAQAANQIATSIATIAAGTAEQLAATDETSATVGQLSAGVQQMAASANRVAEESAKAADKAKEGGQAIAKAIDQMSIIENTVNTSATVVAKLGERSKEIGQIVDTISGIAGQTNLLALNAAIEAARAGEQGRGFAVVAEEVRKLAEQSQGAAKKIAELIGEIQCDTDKAVVAMNDGTQEVRIGADVVNAAGSTFREISDVVTHVSEQVKKISATIQQTAVDSQCIVSSIKKIDELSRISSDNTQNVSAATEEQLASMEEIAASSQSLAKLAQELQFAVAKFRV